MDDPTKLSALARVGRVILVVGLLLLVSILLNLVDIEFRGFAIFRELPGGPLVAKLTIGLPCLITGWIMFDRGGGRQAVAAQKAALREQHRA